MKNAWRSWGAGAVAILAVTIVAYLPVMRGGFLFDDFYLITNNEMIDARDGLYRFWFTTEAPDYYPLTSSLWWFEWRWWGDNPMGYHLLNVIFHAANAVLVWMILRRLKIPGAWLAGLVFAIHPVNVATVAWISEQKNTLSMLLYALAIFLYLRFYEDGRWRWHALSLAAFLLALLSKSAVVMLPVVLLGCVWWLRHKVEWKDVVRSLPFFALSVAFGLVTIWFQHHRALGGAFRTVGSGFRLAAAGGAVWFYLCKALVPYNLTLIYPKWEIDASLWTSYVPGALLLGSLLVFWWKRDTWGRPLVFALGYFVVSLFPVLGFFDQGFYSYSLVADHWQYYSIVGVIALVVASGQNICLRMGKRGPSIGSLASVVVLAILAVATLRRAAIYRSEETLWRDALAKNPDAAEAHYNIGVGLVREGKSEEGIEQWKQQLQAEPNNVEVRYNLGIVLAQAGRTQEAMEQWKQALRLKPDLAEAHFNLGVALAGLGRVKEAIGHWEQALRIRPDYAEAHYNLGVASEQTGDVRGAIQHYEQALRLRPDYGVASNSLARLQAAR
ncbi:MAG: tetratricopeptide repeat protein [Verrucomicrobiia bacterium]